MESHLACKHLTPETAIDLLLLADACSCALLREEAMMEASQHVGKLRGTDDWIKLKQSSDLCAEMLEYLCVDPSSVRDDELANVSVYDIYEEIIVLGAMPTGGSRIALVRELLQLRAANDAKEISHGIEEHPSNNNTE